jgi:putative effector of murein hydrolase LrgA (UPF0299 family)
MKEIQKNAAVGERIKYILIGIVIGIVIGVILLYLLMTFRIIRPFGLGSFPRHFQGSPSV